MVEPKLSLAAQNALLREQLREGLGLPPLPPERSRGRYKRRAGRFRKHFVIPDTQVKPGVRTDHLTWAGKYIKEKASPGDVVVHLGDHWDMFSLSSYDRGKKKFEGRRYALDVKAGNEAFARLTWELDGLDLEKHLLRGNHEDRITRVVEEMPWLEGTVTQDDLVSDGFQVHPFLKPVTIDGVMYVHYTYNPRNGRPWSGNCQTILKNVGHSFVQGHRQGLDTATHELPRGGRRRGVIVGSFYQHDEEYLGPMGDHWRGMLMLCEVAKGDFDICEVSLDFLRRRYG